MSISRLIGAFVCVVAAAAMSGCAGMSTGSNTPSGMTPASGLSTVGGSPTTSTTSSRDLSGVKTWTIHSAHFGGMVPSVDHLATETSDMTIVSPADISAAGKTLASQVSAARGINARKVLALIDVASLNTTSRLWSNNWVDAPTGKLSSTAPAWLNQPNVAGAKTASTSAPATYPVRFWFIDWEKDLKTVIDDARSAGFDGVCLSGLDAYQKSVTERPTAAQDMAKLVVDISNAERKNNSNFIVVPIDDAALISKLSDKEAADYTSAVDGVIAEGVFYGGNKPADNDLNPNVDDISALDVYLGKHKPVFVVDFLNAADKTADFQARARTRSYLGYAIAVKPVPPSTAVAATI